MFASAVSCRGRELQRFRWFENKQEVWTLLKNYGILLWLKAEQMAHNKLPRSENIWNVSTLQSIIRSVISGSKLSWFRTNTEISFHFIQAQTSVWFSEARVQNSQEGKHLIARSTYSTLWAMVFSVWSTCAVPGNIERGCWDLKGKRIPTDICFRFGNLRGELTVWELRRTIVNVKQNQCTS